MAKCSHAIRKLQPPADNVGPKLISLFSTKCECWSRNLRHGVLFRVAIYLSAVHFANESGLCGI